ncbi:FkbM family methyltransferase [Streptomyces oceani]|uniref:Methyltransferase FkbM domain-containing protein n=1 Tax=Streptomyces oceani TaxID=1075402 RepID=A0A1E7KIG0_9ACTN|nr:FkbM family methyltransferase [Streptomyces oceani]OEV03687.1 hypothetical protein AN216_10570 [Streptomyces oceani]
MSEISSSVQIADGVSFFVPQPTSRQSAELGFSYNEIFEDCRYVRYGIQLTDCARIVDAGANVGLFTIFAKQQSPAAEVLAVEPIPAIHRALRANLEAYAIKGVDTPRTALGAEHEREVPFTFYPETPGESTRYPEQKRAGQDLTEQQLGHTEMAAVPREVAVAAEVNRLSALLRDWAPREPVDLLKIDVEGAELDVMEGLDPADWQRTRQVVVEVQDVCGRLDRIIDELDSRDFSVMVERSRLSEVYRSFMVYATRRP